MTYQLIAGDCLKVLPTIPEASVDMIFADPPYFLSSGGITCKNGKMVSVNKGDWDKPPSTIQEELEFHLQWLTECRRLLKPTGTIWVSGTYHNIYVCGYAMRSLGYHTLNEIVQFKPNASPNLACRCFTASHETVIWARRSKKPVGHTFNYKAMKQITGKQMRSVWTIPTTPANEKLLGKHPTQKPLALLERIVRASTNEGDTVLDPFMGSGTTGLAAVMNKRKFIGIEMDLGYYKVAERRIGQEANTIMEMFKEV